MEFLHPGADLHGGSMGWCVTFAYTLCLDTQAETHKQRCAAKMAIYARYSGAKLNFQIEAQRKSDIRPTQHVMKDMVGKTCSQYSFDIRLLTSLLGGNRFTHSRGIEYFGQINELVHILMCHSLSVLRVTCNVLK